MGNFTQSLHNISSIPNTYINIIVEAKCIGICYSANQCILFDSHIAKRNSGMQIYIGHTIHEVLRYYVNESQLGESGEIRYFPNQHLQISDTSLQAPSSSSTDAQELNTCDVENSRPEKLN